jgi:hypothetical protein
VERDELPGDDEDHYAEGQLRVAQPVLGQHVQVQSGGQPEVRVEQGLEGDGHRRGGEEQRQEVEHR